jgi:hypothetical protein
MHLEDLLSVLEQMRDSGGTVQVIIFEHDGMPAICDADEPGNIIAFAPDPEAEDDETLH